MASPVSGKRMGLSVTDAASRRKVAAQASSSSRLAPSTWAAQRTEYGSWMRPHPWWASMMSLPSRARRTQAATATGPGWGRRAWKASPKGRRLASRASSVRPRASTAQRTRRSARCSPSRPRLFIIWVPLMSARPSLASSTRGARPAAASTGPAGTRAPSACSTWPSPMSTSARWARGARSPLAPTEPREGRKGCTSASSSHSSCSTTSGRTPE